MTYKDDFIARALEKDFVVPENTVLSNGALSTYYLTLGNLSSGSDIVEVNYFMTKRLVEEMSIYRFKDPSLVLYGVSGAGESLARGVAAQMYREHGIDVRYAFGRKVSKEHGEGGGLFGGSPMQEGDKIFCIDDILCTGKTIRKEVAKLPDYTSLEGMFFLVDRLESDKGEVCLHLKSEYRCPVRAALTIADLTEAMSDNDSRKSIVKLSTDIGFTTYDFMNLKGNEEFDEATKRIISSLTDSPWLQPDAVVDVVSRMTEISIEQIISKNWNSRKMPYTRARQIAMYVMRTASEKSISYPRIGKIFNKDHSTVISSVRKIADIVGDEDYCTKISS